MEDQVICNNGKATLVIPIGDGKTRKLDFTKDDIETLVFILHYIVAYKETANG